MLHTSSPLNRTLLASPLKGTSRIRPEGARHRRTMIASLMLTSLVDAFSILVIFLIMNHATNQESVNMGKDIQLPKSATTSLLQQGVVVRIEGGKFIVDEKPVALGQLNSVLKKLSQTVKEDRREGLIIVADKEMDYADLSPVILAGSSAGFTKFKFAVLHQE